MEDRGDLASAIMTCLGPADHGTAMQERDIASPLRPWLHGEYDKWTGCERRVLFWHSSCRLAASGRALQLQACRTPRA